MLCLLSLGEDMQRREFTMLLGGAAAAWPLTARAQQPAMPVIGVLSAEWPNLFSDRLRAFHDGLRETGYVQGQNLAIEYRWGGEGRNDRLPALAAELKIKLAIGWRRFLESAFDGNPKDGACAGAPPLSAPGSENAMLCGQTDRSAVGCNDPLVAPPCRMTCTGGGEEHV
jgi:hypothetical protein